MKKGKGKISLLMMLVFFILALSITTNPTQAALTKIIVVVTEVDLRNVDDCGDIFGGKCEYYIKIEYKNSCSDSSWSTTTSGVDVGYEPGEIYSRNDVSISKTIYTSGCTKINVQLWEDDWLIDNEISANVGTLTASTSVRNSNYNSLVELDGGTFCISYQVI